ncbi:hypothetical protein [Tardiphaga sp. OK245]|nr:hypothetical protein [Tardiphaga sp. OK245]
MTKVLTALGVDALMTNIAETAGPERLKTIKVGELRIAAKLAKGGMAI